VVVQESTLTSNLVHSCSTKDSQTNCCR